MYLSFQLKKRVEAHSLNPPCLILLVLAKTVLSVELIDTAAYLSCLLLTSVELMAGRADLNVDLRLRGTGRKCIPAVAGNLSLIILRMDSFSHDIHLS